MLRKKGRDPALTEAIRRSGGVTQLAHKMSVEGSQISKGAISLWTSAPLKRVRMISKISGVAMRKLRPDVF